MFQSGMSCAVLGARGFIGSALAGRLDASGVDCARFTRSRPFLIDGGLAPELARAQTIFWLVSSIRPATQDTANHAEKDLHLLETLLRLLADRRDRPPRVVALSSAGTVYDSATAPPYAESSPTRAANAYGEAMLEVEAAINNGAANPVVLRVSNAYGPGQPARRGQGVIAHWLDAVLREEPVRVLGDPSTKRDYVYIDDLVDALVAAAELPDDESTPRLVNIGSGAGTSLADLLDIVVDVVGQQVEIEYSGPRAFDAPSTWVDISLAKQALGFSPRVDLHQGLRRSWEWMRLQRTAQGLG